MKQKLLALLIKQTKAVADKINKDRIEANRKRYYKLMGIDKMNKDAVYRYSNRCK